MSALSAQYYSVPYVGIGRNPGGLNKDVEYPVNGGISAGWTTLLAGNKTSPVWSNRTKLPFTFKFNGTDYDSFYVSSSGVLTFSSSVGTAPAYANNALPDAAIPDNSVCVRGILTAGNNSSYANIVTKTFGANGSRQYYVTFSAYNELGLGSTGFIWFSVMLEEGTNSIYFIDQRKYPATATNLTLGLQFSSSSAMQVSGSPNFNMSSAAGSNEKDNSYYRFTPGTQPTVDVEGIENEMPDYLALTQLPFVVKGTFKNNCSAGVSNFNINYSINNGAAVSAAGTATIAQNKVVSVSSPTSWTPSVAGVYKVAAWLSDINGNTDEFGVNDTIIKYVNVVDDYVVRMPLHEVFTSSTCGPCYYGNKNTDETIFPQYPGQFTVIKYQMSWPGTGDPYCTTEGNTRRALYNVSAIPNMQVDGGWNGNANSYTTALFDEFKAKPSFIKIEATHVINFKKVTVDVKITPLADYNNANLKVFVAILEKSTVNNVKTNGETEFFHVLKKFLPDANGTALGAVTKNNVKTFSTMTWNVPGNYRLPADGQTSNIIKLTTENSIENLQNCEVVVFVQDLNTKEVYQSANSVGTVLSVDDVYSTDGAISVYPNPAVGTANLSFSLNSTVGVKVNIYNVMGQVVKTIDASQLVSGMNNLSFSTEEFSSGIYTVKIEGNGFTATEKFIVE